MTIARWNPPVAPTRREQFLLKRLGRVRKLFGFLRVHRHELFNDAFQDELASMYRTTGAGKDALPPAMMAMAMLVQGYLGISDAEMVELTVVDLRVQMVLGCLGTEAPAFSQGALTHSRCRLSWSDWFQCADTQGLIGLPPPRGTRCDAAVAINTGTPLSATRSRGSQVGGCNGSESEPNLLPAVPRLGG